MSQPDTSERDESQIQVIICDSLDFKNGKPFEAENEKISELQAEIDANEAWHIRVLQQAREIGELKNEITRLREALLVIRNTSYEVSKSYEIAETALKGSEV